MEALKELKIPIVRWPGGCFVDSYHWQNGIGENRIQHDDFRWGVIEPNTFGTDEFIRFCKEIKAEPYICHNSFSDKHEITGWIKYCNALEGEFAEMRKQNGNYKPFKVKYWSMGNERYDKAYIKRVREGAKAIKKLDPRLQITCSALQGGMKEISFELLEKTGEYVDYISVHNYWLASAPYAPRYNYMTAISKSEMPEAFISNVIKTLEELGLKERIKIAFDEWNLRAWQHSGFPKSKIEDYNDPEIRELVERRRWENDIADQYTMADALFSASFLNTCLRHPKEVEMANIAPLVNTRGPLFVHSKGIVKRTHFHTMWMYSNMLYDRVVDVKIDSKKMSSGASIISVVDAIATVDKDGGKWAIAMINRHPNKKLKCSLKMNDLTLDGTYECVVLKGESCDAYNDVDNPNRVIPVKTYMTLDMGSTELPACSLTILLI
jgi:alpha-N-arabinofuranosidase